MTSPARVPCVNPRCRRTAPFCANDTEADVICGKCWRSLPHALRTRYQQLQRRQKRMLRLIERRIDKGTIRPELVVLLEQQFERRCAENWRTIRAFFAPTDRPAGLDGFLQEIGLQ